MLGFRCEAIGTGIKSDMTDPSFATVDQSLVLLCAVTHT